MGDNTGTIHQRSQTIFIQMSEGAVNDSFEIIDGASEIQQGRAVKLTGDAEVGPLTAVTDKPIGLASAGAVEGERVAVMYFADARVKGFNNTGGTLTRGTLVKQVIPQEITDFKMHYSTAAATEYAIGEVLCDSADQADVIVKIFDEPQLIA